MESQQPAAMKPMKQPSNSDQGMTWGAAVAGEPDRATEVFLKYQYRLRPTRAQHAKLAEILEAQRVLYNAALEERIGCYRKTGKTRTYNDQTRALTECRRLLPEMAQLPANLQRETLWRLDAAYRAFLRRVGSGVPAGFPRFKGKGWFKSFGFREFSGISFDGKRLRFKGMPGALRVHLHRPLPDTELLSCAFRRDAKGWLVAFAVKVAAGARQPCQRTLGIDLGLSDLAVGSDGSAVPNVRANERSEKAMRRTQRAYSRTKQHSKRRLKAKARLARLNQRIANTRTDALHRATAALVARCDMIAIEAIDVRKLSRGMFARQFKDASWGRFIEMLRYKAERAGVELREVDPRYTTQECSGCGAIAPKTLSERQHSCVECGLTLSRDENAARVILHRAVVGPAGVNVIHQGERCPRNLNVKEASL